MYSSYWKSNINTSLPLFINFQSKKLMDQSLFLNIPSIAFNLPVNEKVKVQN